MTWELATFSADLLREPEAIDGVEVEIVPPGSPVRVTHVLDAVEPRIRPDGRAAFPSEGRAGRGADEPARRRRRPLVPRLPRRGAAPPRAGVDRRSRRAGRRAHAFRRHDGGRPHVLCGAAEATGRSTRGPAGRRSPSRRRSPAGPSTREPEEVERFELGPAEESLPAVAALIQISDLGPLYIQYVYGTPAGEAGLPRAVDPAEVLDGAVTCGEYHWAAMRNPTWFFQRNELIRTLYREHGKTLRFAGVVLMRGYEQSAADKQRAAERAAAAAGELGADGVVITTDAGGNSHTDVMLTCRACEQAGIRTTVVLAEETDPQSTKPILTDWVREADSIVSTGNVEELVEAWTPERVLGGDLLLDGSPAAEAGPIPVRNYLGAANQMGQLALSARTE